MFRLGGNFRFLSFRLFSFGRFFGGLGFGLRFSFRLFFRFGSFFRLGFLYGLGLFFFRFRFFGSGLDRGFRDLFRFLYLFLGFGGRGLLEVDLLYDDLDFLDARVRGSFRVDDGGGVGFFFALGLKPCLLLLFFPLGFLFLLFLLLP